MGEKRERWRCLHEMGEDGERERWERRERGVISDGREERVCVCVCVCVCV